MIIHFILIGLVFGLGAAIPIGPINIEMMRRNLSLNAIAGFIFGLGACLADVTYLLLTSFTTMTVFSHPLFLRIIGFLGSLVIGWLGYKALLLPAKSINIAKVKRVSLIKQLLQGYLLTLLNPITVLFWVSVSAQVVALSKRDSLIATCLALGVIIGIVIWLMGFNYFLHKTHHRLPKSAIVWINKIGGIILLGFALLGLMRVAVW